VSLTEDLTRARIIFVDTAVVIYHVEAHPVFGELAREAVHTFRSGDVRAFTSAMTLVEVLPKPVSAGREDVAATFLEFLLHTRNLALLEVTVAMAEKAGRLRGQYRGLRSADAVQLAAAILAGVQAFVTNDTGLRKIRELKIILLSDYLPSPATGRP
jgi:predicted nucleic acid-binding protein